MRGPMMPEVAPTTGVLAAAAMLPPLVLVLKAMELVRCVPMLPLLCRILPRLLLLILDGPEVLPCPISVRALIVVEVANWGAGNAGSEKCWRLEEGEDEGTPGPTEEEEEEEEAEAEAEEEDTCIGSPWRWAIKLSL